MCHFFIAYLLRKCQQQRLDKIRTNSKLGAQTVNIKEKREQDVLMPLRIQSAAVSRPQTLLTSELYVTLRHHYTSQPKWPKKIWNV